MNKKGSRILPIGPATKPGELIETINDRFRRMEALIPDTAATTTSTGGTSTRGGSSSGSTPPVTPPLTLSFAGTPGQVGVFYRTQLTAGGGVTPYVFSVFSGSLPSGLSLDFSTGVISGTPKAPTGASFTIRLTDSVGTPSVNLACVIVVAALSGQGNNATVPSAGLITSFAATTTQIPTGTSQNPYNAIDQNGRPYFSIPGLALDDSPCAGHPEIAFVRITAQDYDSGANPIGPEQPFARWPLSALGVHNFGPLQGRYLDDGGTYTRSGDIASVWLRVYLCNSVDQTAYSFQNAACAAKQTGVGGGAGYIQVLVASGGAAPDGASVDLTGSKNPGNTHGGGHQIGNMIGTGRDGRPAVLNNNLAASLASDPSFEYATAGVLGGGGLAPGWSWGLSAGSSIEIKTDGGNSGANYARMTGPDAAFFQSVSVQPGLSLYVQIAARSSNTAGAAHAIGVYITWLDANNAPLSPYTTIVGTVSGYVSAWTNNALSGYATAPAGAAKAVIKISTSAGEPGYWDLDDVIYQPTINQTASGQTNTTVPAAGSGDLSALRSNTGADLSAAYYGRVFAQLTAANGTDYAFMYAAANDFPQFVTHSATSGDAQMISNGGFATLVVASLNGNEKIVLNAGNAGLVVTVRTGGVSHTGFTGTVTTSGGVKNVINGFICN